MTWLLILVLFAVAMAFLWYKQEPPKAHGEWTPPPTPKPTFTLIEDELLKDLPPLAKLVDDKFIETLPPPPQGKAKTPRSHHKKEK